MKKVMIVDDNALSAEGIVRNIDWELLDAEVVHVRTTGIPPLNLCGAPLWT